MTTFARKGREGVATAKRRRLVLAWSISPQAVAGAGLADGCEAARLEIEVPAPGDRGVVMARLVVDGVGRVLGGIAGEAGWVEDGTGLVHLDSPEVLHATARVGDRVTVLYARTSLLGRLGLGGGRYEFDGGR